MIRPRRGWLEELLIAYAIPGFLFCVGWTVMYEIYHEDGSFYTTLLQEILGEEGFFPLFLISAILMAFPVGLILDALRGLLDTLGLLRTTGVPPERRSLHAALLQSTPVPATVRERYLLLQFAQSVLITPAKAAGNLAIVLAIFLIWFVIKIIRIEGWHTFSLAFIIGTPVVGCVLIVALVARYRAGVAEFRHTLDRLLPAAPAPPAAEPAVAVHSVPAPDTQM
jgi:hypothetical protein